MHKREGASKASILSLKVLEHADLIILPAPILLPPMVMGHLGHTDRALRIRDRIGWPCEASASTRCISATISSGIWCLLGLLALSRKARPQGGTTQERITENCRRSNLTI